MIEIRHLQLLKVLSETKNVTRAAEQLFLSQSALSHQLRGLQDHFNGELFTRSGKEMIPTMLGQSLIASAEEILPQLKAAEEKAMQIAKGSVGNIRISTACYTFYHWLSPVLKTFRSSYPNIELALVTDAAYQLESFFKAGKLDVSLTHYKPTFQGIESFPLFEDELLLVVHQDHPFAVQKIVEIEQLAEVHYITYQADLKKSITYQEVFKSNNVAPQKITHVQLTEAILEMIRANMGVSILSNWAIQPHLLDGELVAIRIGKKGVHRRWWASILKQKVTPHYLENFIECFHAIELNR